MQNDKLLPCPFCGSKHVELGLYVRKRVFSTYVACVECFSKTNLFDTDEEAIKAWNTRKPMERIVEQLEKEKEKANERAMTENSIHGHTLDFECFYGQRMGFCQAIEIVKGGVNNAE